MILNILIFAAGLFLLLNLFLVLFPLEKQIFYTNEERAQEFVYSNINYPVIIVGSGLIGHFKIEPAQSKNLANLFFPYSGSCSGVEVIALSNKIPRTLFIETNYIFKGFDTPLIKRLFRPGLYHLRYLFPSLLKKHSISSFLLKIFKRLGIGSRHRTRPGSTFAPRIEFFKKAYEEVPERRRFLSNLKKLKNYVDHFSSKGCTIIFFEMPLDAQLTNAPLFQFQRSELEFFFANYKGSWVYPDPCDKYYFVDGIHLVEESAFKYFAYLDKSCNSILSV